MAKLAKQKSLKGQKQCLKKLDSIRVSKSGDDMCPGCRASQCKETGLNGFCALMGKGRGQEAGAKTWGPSKVGSQTGNSHKKSEPPKMTTSVDE